MMAILPLSSTIHVSPLRALILQAAYLGDCVTSACTLYPKPEQCKNPSGDDAEIAQPVAITGSDGYGKWLMRCDQFDSGKAMQRKTYNM
jgi:hypothetical protein